MDEFFQNLKNKFDFNLRQFLNISRKNYCLKNESKEGLFTSKEMIEAEKLLVEKYNLEFLKNNSTRQNYLENLYTVDLLDKYLPIELKSEISVLDIGCKNWFYAKGEHSFFKKHCEALTVDGIEIDSQRLYNDFYSRAEAAKFYIKGLENTKYIQGDFLNHTEKYDYLVWFLPFIFEYPHLKWGLPLKYFKPEKMLLHAYNSLNKAGRGGKIFVINQGEDEFEAQKALCEELNIPYTPVGVVESAFLTYKYPRYLVLIG
jgi:SAM-dependent methyltransferase